MPGKVTFEEAQKRFSDRDDISLSKKDWNGWKKKSRFYDHIQKDYFWAIPEYVYRLKTSHPIRGTKKSAASRRIPIEKVLERFSERDDIFIVENSYISWEKKALFYDKIQGEHWEASPKKVYYKKSVHPKRVTQKRKETNIKKYGAPCPLTTPEIRKKTQQTIFAKYGVEHFSKTEEFKDKHKTTSFERYGTANPSQSKQIKEKVKQTNLKRWGVEYVSQNEEIKKKTKVTNLKRYGVEYFSQTEKSKNAHRKRAKENQNSVTFTNRFVVYENKKIHLKEWLKNQNPPKPSYSSLKRVFPNKEIPFQEIELFLENFRNLKTNLEHTAEQLFEVKHFNKKPVVVSNFYKPDFKLSEALYLNVDGLYWHSEAVQSDKWYHFNLRKHFEESNVRIFQFRENEIYHKPEIVKSIVNNNLGKTVNKIGARSCIVKLVSNKQAKKFLKQNHLMGAQNAKHIGLYCNNQLVSLLSYKQKNNICKIERFCSLLNTSVIGGFSKLLNYLEQNCLDKQISEIHNWVDLRYGTGAHLVNKSFTQQKETLGWCWTDLKTTFNRLKCRANMDNRRLSQQQHADELGWFKLYDAGQRLYVKQL